MQTPKNTIFISVRMSSIMVAGGYSYGKMPICVQVVSGDSNIKQFPSLPDTHEMQWPKGIGGPSLVIHSKTILLCGAGRNAEKCLQLDDDSWKEHSIHNYEGRFRSSIVSTHMATFIFGGRNAENTYEYLPIGSTTWQVGKTAIPGGFKFGFAIANKSDKEIWLFGGKDTGRRILSFNPYDHTFSELPTKLNISRSTPRCAYIPGTNQIAITGGDIGYMSLKHVEYFDTKDRSISMGFREGHLNFPRTEHGIGIVTINDEEKLAVFGGCGEKFNKLNDVEFYNTKTETWETSDITLKEPNWAFASLTFKPSDLKLTKNY